MKKWLILLMAAGSLFLNQPFTSAEKGDLSSFTNSGKPVKVFLGAFTSESGGTGISADDFKKYLETALLNRKSVSFRIAGTPAESDVRISAVIKKYLYSKTDPVTSFAGPGGILLDAATTENYVEMTAQFTITDTKTGRVIWDDSIKSFVKRMMTPEESVPVIYDKLSRDFLWRSFGKPRR